LFHDHLQLKLQVCLFVLCMVENFFMRP